MRWLLVIIVLAGCSSKGLRARAQGDEYGRHQRMLFALLAHARGEYGAPGSEDAYEHLRRDLMRARATKYDLERLAGAGPEIWRHTDARVSEITTSKALAGVMAAAEYSWRRHHRPGDNDMWQAGVFFPPLGLAMLQRSIDGPSKHDEENDAYFDQHYPGWRNAGAGEGDGNGGANNGGDGNGGGSVYIDVEDAYTAPQPAVTPVDHCRSTYDGPASCMQKCMGYAVCDCKNRCEALRGDARHKCDVECFHLDQSLTSTCNRMCYPAPPPSAKQDVR